MNGHLPDELLRIIFSALVDDSQTLARAGLVCHAWRVLSLPAMLRSVDLSSHNNGRLPEHEAPESFVMLRVVMSDASDEHRPHSLVPRQRAFLRLMVERPELAAYVKTFTWTLAWKNLDDEGLTDRDKTTWDVFSRLRNVTTLDLASLHDISCEPYIREVPVRLFPAVTSLRLVGWMSRRLVRAIVDSLDPKKLRSLHLDHLQDEGLLPTGLPVPQDMARRWMPEAGDAYADDGISEELWKRQEGGVAVSFPGPMWFPLRLLRGKALASLAHLKIDVGTFDTGHDFRTYVSMFKETAKLVRCAENSLQKVFISLGESPLLFCEDDRPTCGTSRIRRQFEYRPMCFDVASVFLHRVLGALAEGTYPHLARVGLKGFRIVNNGKSRLARPPSPGLTWQYIRDCPFVTVESIENPNLDYRPAFTGYEYDLLERQLEELSAVEADWDHV